MILSISRLLIVGALMPFAFMKGASFGANKKMNVILIICDDLNDYVENFGGHPQARTPNIKKLARTGVSFVEAHCNIPICNPSRASMLTGLYPHTSRCYGFEHWDKNEVLNNSRTIMDHFRANGYYVLGTGKVMHNRDRREWEDYGHPADYGPFANDGGEKDISHPDVPSPFAKDFGAVDGSFGPLKDLQGKISDSTGKPLIWKTGNWKTKRELRYISDKDRDSTGDELNAQWALEKLKSLSKSSSERPFFMGVGFVRPHTPLIVPQKYFDMFALETISLPKIRDQDATDTFKHTLNSNEDDRGGDRGTKMHDSLVSSFQGDKELALKKFIQAYLASIASIDELIGKVIDFIDKSSLKDNTIIVFTSDHGWGMGEKGYLYKNSLWQESTRVPLIIRSPGSSSAGASCDVPVSLVDLYPTLLELCELPNNTLKNSKGRPLDGHSLVSLLREPRTGQWAGPKAALTALYKWSQNYIPNEQSYSLRSKRWRYIRYANGKEELYNVNEDPQEWNNLAYKSEHGPLLRTLKNQLFDRISHSEPSASNKEIKKDAEYWKSKFFEKYPEADTDKNGKLSWKEHKIHKAKITPKK